MHAMKPLAPAAPSGRKLLFAGFLLPGLIGLILLLLPWAGEPVALGQNPEPKDEIVYIDVTGTIKVFDPIPPGQTGDNPRIIWESPPEHGSWDDVAVGDFDGDGDAEIVAIKSSSDAPFNLAIYDPVVGARSPVTPAQVLYDRDGIVPWRLLYTRTIPGTPGLVAAADFDPFVIGDEILFAYRPLDNEGSGMPFALQVIQRAADDILGERWVNQTPPIPTNVDWRRWSAGQIDNTGGDEIALVGREGQNAQALSIYRVDGATLTPLYEYAGLTRRWEDAVIGQFYAGNFGEVALVREADGLLPRLFVFRYEPQGDEYFSDAYSEYFAPSPRRVFAGDIDASGDDEIFMLRPSARTPPPPTPTPPPVANLFMRNLAGPAIPTFEVSLDRDGGYQEGATAQLDGDANQEIAIARRDPDRILVFYQPNVDSRATVYSGSVNSALRVGNLDAIGMIQFPVLTADPVDLNQLQVSPGQGPVAYTLTLRVNPLPQIGPTDIQFTVSTVGEPAWISLAPTSGHLPAMLEVTINGDGLQPLQTLNATILAAVVDDDRFANPVLAIPVRLQVLSGLLLRPSSLLFFTPCGLDDPPPAIDTQLGRIAVTGLTNVPYSLRFEPDQPAWLTHTTSSTLLPTNITVGVNPALRRPGILQDQTTLVLNSTTNQGTPLQATVPILLLCEQSRLWLPLAFAES
jgi:hypothetical protein